MDREFKYALGAEVRLKDSARRGVVSRRSMSEDTGRDGVEVSYLVRLHDEKLTKVWLDEWEITKLDG